MRELLRATALNTTARVISLAFAVLGAKLIALKLEPAGVGVVSQVSTYAALATNVLTFGLGVGVTRFVAEYRARADRDRLKRLIATGFAISLLGSGAASLLLLLFASHIVRFAFGDGAPYARFIGIVTLTIPFSVTASFVVNLLQGFKQVATLAKITVITGFVDLLLLLVFVPNLRLTGGIYALAGAALANLIVNGWFLARVLGQELGTGPSTIVGKLRALPQWVDVLALAPLVVYGLSSLIVGGAGSLIDFFARAKILHTFGEAAGGYYQSAYTISNGYLPLILGAMSTYSFPRFSELDDPGQIRAEIGTTFRFALLVIVPVLVLLMITTDLVIPLLWSPKFLVSVAILRAQLLADFFMVTAWALGIVLLPMKRVRFWLLNSLMTQGLMLGALVLLFPRIGLMGAVYNYLIAWIVSATAVYVYLRQTLNFSLSRESVLFFFGSLALVVFSFLMTKLPYPTWGFSGGALAVWALLFVRKEELGHAGWLLRSFLRRDVDYSG